MTTSANSAFDPQSDEITRTALHLCQVLNADHEPDAGQLRLGRVFQNLAAKAISNEGVSLRVIERVTVTVAEGDSSITPGTDTEDVTSAYFTDTSDIDHPIGKLALGEYDNISDKASTNGPPTWFVFDKANGTARIRLYPPADATVSSVTYARIRRLRDMDDGSVTLDLPSSWQLAFTYKVAGMFSDHFGFPDRSEHFEALYEKERNRANQADTETGPVRFVVGEGVTYN